MLFSTGKITPAFHYLPPSPLPRMQCVCEQACRLVMPVLNLVTQLQTWALHLHSAPYTADISRCVREYRSFGEQESGDKTYVRRIAAILTCSILVLLLSEYSAVRWPRSVNLELAVVDYSWNSSCFVFRKCYWHFPTFVWFTPPPPTTHIMSFIIRLFWVLCVCAL